VAGRGKSKKGNATLLQRKQMRNIDKVLSEHAATVLSAEQFGHGKGYYADLEGKKFPRIWIYDTFPTINNDKYGNIGSVTYNVLGGVQKSQAIDDSPETLVEALGECQMILMQYMGLVSKDDRITVIGRIKCEENWHLLADNVQEISFAVEITMDEPYTPIC